MGLDGKVLRGSFLVEDTNSDCPPHPAIMLVSAYLVERGLILKTHKVDKETNEIKALPGLRELPDYFFASPVSNDSCFRCQG